jgi:pyruvate dehydrogenase E1 component beta subunit
MNYKEEIFKGMELLNSHPKTIFMGQAVEYAGTALTHQVKNFPKEKLLELPVAEEFQAGVALGLAIEGYIPVSMYPRMNFIILAMNQIVNHQSKPKVIMKAVVGSEFPLDPGHQHKANYTQSFKSSCTNIDVVELLYPDKIVQTYEKALSSDRSTLIIEHGDLYR